MKLNFSGPCAEKGNTLIMLISKRFTTVSINSQSAFYPESAFYPQSAVCSLQSAFYTDRFTNRPYHGFRRHFDG